MSRHLVIAEVSQKQAYIFGNRELRRNIQRSAEIAHATNSDELEKYRKYFQKCCPHGYSKEQNLVYAGGGHTILQFPNRPSAEYFCKALTKKTLETYPDMELFVKIMELDTNKSIRDNLNELTRQLEIKKARRQSSFRPLNFGVELFDAEESSYEKDAEEFSYKNVKYEPAGWKSTNDLKDIAGSENFIAIVHLDGNAMGARVQNIYGRFSTNPFSEDDWEECVKTLNQFSTEIDTHFQEAYKEMVDELADRLTALDEASEKKRWEKHILPVRKIIGAGDDVCFVTAGDLGIECAVSFIQHLSTKKNTADQTGYTACAGVVMVHTKYPFRVAYDLSEELCSSAKRYGAALCNEQNKDEGAISLVDWHIEFGQIRGSLSQIRNTYQTEDGGQLELRPFIVEGADTPIQRTYKFFRTLSDELMKKSKDLPRSKVKQLRDSFKQGEWETKLAMKQTRMRSLTEKGLEARNPDLIKRMVQEYFQPEQEAFYTDENGTRRCLYYDAIEVIDHLTLWRKEEQE